MPSKVAVTSRFWRAGSGMIAVAVLLCGTPRAAAAGVEVDVGLPNGSDDTAAIQALLTQGKVVLLRPGATYHILKRLDVVKNNSGILTRGAPATLRLARTFANVDPYTMFSLPCQQPPCPAAHDDSVGIRAERVTDVVLQNFKLEKEHIDGTYVSGIWLRSVTRGKLEGLNLSGFSLGAIVALDSVHEVTIRGSTIHDSWASTASILPDHNRFPQLTGIWFDDNRDVDVNGARIPSTDVVIANNTISKLRFRQRLFDMPRQLFDGMAGRTDPVGHQTDGITVGPPATNVTIRSNVIDLVGEGIDCMGQDVRIEENRITNTYDCALKFIHGASHNVAYRNTLDAAGYATVCMAGSSMSSVGNTFDNLIAENTITRVGDRTAYSAAVDPGFSLTFPRGTSAFAVDIQAAWSQLRRPYYNIVQGNRISATSSDVGMGHLFRAEAPAQYSLFCGNVFTNHTGRIIDNVFDPNVGTQFEPWVDRVAVHHVDVRNLADHGARWNEFGENRLCRQNDSGTLATDLSCLPPSLMSPTAVKRSPEHPMCGDFERDGCEELLLHWRPSGTNHFYSPDGGAPQTANPGDEP